MSEALESDSPHGCRRVRSDQIRETNYTEAREGGGMYMFNYYLLPAPSTTPWAPAWSPDGRSVALAMYGSVWKVDPASGTAAELTYNSKYHSCPTWSPDGKWIVYTADDDAKTIQLEILNVRTGESHSLTSDGQIFLDPVFSPDGTNLCYVATKPGGHFNILVRRFNASCEPVIRIEKQGV